VFGTLGFPEMIIIFLLALVLFGPNKLPEIGRTIGKAITEFRKASSELKETFTTEYQNLERETESLRQAATESIAQVTNDYQYDSSYNYDYSSYESQTEGSNGNSADSAASDPLSESASAPQGAELTSAEPPEGAIAHGSVIEEQVPAEAAEPERSGEPRPQEAPASPSAEHKA
jgi:sec-independent protein translocase protein TatA